MCVCLDHFKCYGCRGNVLEWQWILMLSSYELCEEGIWRRYESISMLVKMWTPQTL